MKPKYVLYGHLCSVSAVLIYNYIFIISGDEEGNIFLWKNGIKCCSLSLSGKIMSIIKFNDAILVQSLLFSFPIKLKISNEKLETTTDINQFKKEIIPGFCKMALSDKYIVFAKNPNTISFLEISNLEQIFEIDFSPVVCHCCVASDGFFVFGLDDGSIAAYDSSLNFLYRKQCFKASIFALLILDGFVFVAGAIGAINIYNLRLDLLLIRSISFSDFGISYLCPSEFENRVFFSTWDGKIKIFDFKTDNIELLFQHRAFINCISSYGTLFATSSNDKSIIVCNMPK